VDDLKRLILASEDELLRRLLDYARSTGYAQHMPALEDAYRMAIASTSASMAQMLALAGGISDLRAIESTSDDPVASFGARWARRTRPEVPQLALFMGLLKYYRRSYKDVVTGGGMGAEPTAQALTFVDRYFDRLEIGCIAEWSSTTPDEDVLAIRESNLDLMATQNRYVAAFHEMPIPVFFLGADGHVESTNHAAAALFGEEAGGRFSVHALRDRRSRMPVLGEEIEAFGGGPDVETSFERELKTGKGTRYFQVRLRKLTDAGGGHAGIVVMLTDLTYRRHAEDALRRSQSKYMSLFENMTTGFAYMQTVLDRKNRPSDYVLLEVNSAFEDMAGLVGGDIVGRKLTEILPGIESSRFDWLGQLARVAVTGESTQFDALAEPLGRWYSVSAFSATPGHVTMMLSDISEIKWIQESLAQSRDFYLTLFQGFPSLIWRAGPEGAVDYVNLSWLEFTGRTLEQETGDGWLADIHPEDRERRVAAFRTALEAHTGFQIEYRLRHHSGEYRWVLDSGRPFDDLNGGFGGFIGSAQDVSERRREEEQLHHLATHDALTGLPNRRVFEDALKRSVAHARRGHPSCVMFVDLDDFKTINDTRGHAQGDRALVQVSDLIVTALRADDLVARYGGDEFAVLLPDSLMEDACLVATRLLAAMAGADIGTGAGGSLGMSIGLVDVDGETDSEATLSHADAAMYRAKETGGNRVLPWQPDWVEEPSDTRTGLMIARLRDALVRDGALVFHYQPVFDLSTGEVAYSEALLRLVDRDQRITLPGEFISVAERSGLMPQLSRWVVRQAAIALRSEPAARLSVNVSGVDLGDERLLDDIAAELADAEVAADRLSFEVSEAAVIHDLPAARRWIERIRDMGCSFALDDFGAGFNSFAYLRELPVDRVKVDGSVVRSLMADPRQLTLLEAVKAVADQRGLETVAECIENEYLLEIVREVGMKYGQGYALGRPSPDLVCSATAPWEGRPPHRPAVLRKRDVNRKAPGSTGGGRRG
jgi:diguanylate cyclase (GGDEF)-like protein/PAS domain S-box-containing protein